MRPSVRAIDINSCAQRVATDDRISLSYYYRIAANLLKQANVYREEKNLIDLYIILLRFSSLMCETIPAHRDYQALLPKEKALFRKKLLDVIDELELLKPEVQRQVDELNRGLTFHSPDREKLAHNYISSKKQVFPVSRVDQTSSRSTIQSLRNPSNQRSHIISSDHLPVERSFQKLSLSLPYPKEETLSRHSILGPDGLRGKINEPVTGIKVQYPSNFDVSQVSTSRPNEGDFRKSNYDMESILSLDDGRWSIHEEESDPLATTRHEQESLALSLLQPSPPPVLAQVQSQPHMIPPERVADPRPGPAKSSDDGMSDSKAYQHLHVPVNMLESFLRLAEKNTARNLETCGVLAGSLKDRKFYVTTLIIPKQESTSDSCQTTDEDEIFNIQDKMSLFPLGWIHTHPTQTCFMSSIDLHTHYSYQIMLPEAVAIVMAPTDTSRKHGIFHLSDPSGVTLIRNCQERGFHPHEETPDGTPIYEHCSHVYMNPSMKYEVIDLRSS